MSIAAKRECPSCDLKRRRHSIATVTEASDRTFDSGHQTLIGFEPET